MTDSNPDQAALRTVLSWSPGDFSRWLRQALRYGTYHPLLTPKESSEVIHFSQLLQRYQPDAKDRVREVLYDVLREWAAPDGAGALHDTLVLIADLRAARCLPEIELLLRGKRLLGADEADRVGLTQLALNVIAGVGPDRAHASLFSAFMPDPDYADIAYFGSYRVDQKNAYLGLPLLLSCYAKDNLRLGTAVKRFLVEFLKPPELERAVPQLLDAARGQWSLLLRALESVHMRIEQCGNPAARGPELLQCRRRRWSQSDFEDLGAPFPMPSAPHPIDLAALPAPRRHLLLLMGGAAV